MPVITTKNGVRRMAVKTMVHRSSASAWTRDMRVQQNAHKLRTATGDTATGIRAETINERTLLQTLLGDPKTGIVERVKAESRIRVIQGIILDYRWDRFEAPEPAPFHPALTA